MSKAGKKKGSIVTSLGGPFLLILILLGYIVYSQWDASRKAEFRRTIQSDLKNLCVAEEDNFADHKTYSTDMEIHTTKGVTIEIVRADKNYFEAKGTHFELNDTYWIKSGADSPCRLYRQEEGSSKLNKL